MESGAAQRSRERVRFRCPHCERRYARPFELRQHLVTHTDERRYVCMECASRFATRSNIFRHQRTCEKLGSTPSFSPPLFPASLVAEASSNSSVGPFEIFNALSTHYAPNGSYLRSDISSRPIPPFDDLHSMLEDAFWDGTMPDAPTDVPLNIQNLNYTSRGVRDGGVGPDSFTTKPTSLFHDTVNPDITHEIHNKIFVASGGYSSVYSAEWKNVLVSPSKVAVKMLRVARIINTRERLILYEREARIWKSLDHPNTVPLLGFVVGGEGPGFVSPWYPCGNIRQYLEQASIIPREDLCEDVAVGLRYLHQHVPPIVHGDLKGANILVGGDGRAALCDFGMSMALDSSPTVFTSSNVGGTFRYMAPELFGGDMGDRSLPSDVYSYACTYAEIMTEEVPFCWHRAYVTILRSLSQGKFPYEVGSIISRHSLGFLELGWATEPAHRPTMSNICESLGIGIVDRL